MRTLIAIVSTSLVLSGCVAAIPYDERTSQYKRLARNVTAARTSGDAVSSLQRFIATCNNTYRQDVEVSGVDRETALQERNRCMSIANQLADVPSQKPATYSPPPRRTPPRAQRTSRPQTSTPPTQTGGTFLDILLAPPNTGCRYDNGHVCPGL